MHKIKPIYILSVDKTNASYLQSCNIETNISGRIKKFSSELLERINQNQFCCELVAGGTFGVEAKVMHD